jgi:ABC-type transporter Mla subunit MlaD
MTQKQFRITTAIALLAVALSTAGCTQEETDEMVQSAEQSAGEALEKSGDAMSDAAEKVGQGVSDAAEKGKEMASQLGEKAVAFLEPLKTQFGDLESLKDKPEQLKEKVNELIQMIEGRAEDMKLPEKVQETLAASKAKLIELKEYLQGEIEQAELDKKLENLMETVKGNLGLSDQG